MFHSRERLLQIYHNFFIENFQIRDININLVQWLEEGHIGQRHV